jgi:transcriptional regulator with XRE-family HTH domain
VARLIGALTNQPPQRLYCGTVTNPDLKRLGARLRRLRRERGLSLGEVAKATDISASFLSHVENGKSDITFMRLDRLVALYGASLMDLAAPQPANERIIRASERELLASAEEHFGIYLLAPDAKRSMMPIMVVYEPGGGSVEPFRTESEEFIHVIHGAVEISFEDGEVIELAKGDSVYLIEPHRFRTYRNASRGQTISLSVLSPPAL